MSKENENFDMSLFESDSFELNMGDDNPFLDTAISDDTTDDNLNPDNVDDKDNINPNEGADDPEKVVKDELENKGNEDSNDDTSPNIYSSFASVLNEQGLLPSLENNDEIKTVDDLTVALKSEIQNQYKDFIIDKIGEDGFDALEKGVSLAEFQEHQDNTLVLEGIQSDKLGEDLELSKNIILQDYLAQGLSEDRALRILKKTIDLGDEAIIEDAQQSLESLKEFQGARLEKLKAENALKVEKDQLAQEKIDNDLKNSIYNVNEIIKDIKLNKTNKDNLYNSITKIVSKSPEGMLENQLMKDRRDNPIDFDIKMHYFYNLTNGFKDFSSITRKSTSKAVNNLESALRNNNPNEHSAQPGFLNDPDSYGGYGDELVF